MLPLCFLEEMALVCFLYLTWPYYTLYFFIARARIASINMQKDRPDLEVSLADKLGMSGAEFYHVRMDRVDGGKVKDLETALSAFEPSRSKFLIIDLEGVNYINDGGFHVLVGVLRRYGKAEGKVVLLDVSRQVADKLGLLGFTNTLFDSYASNR